MRSRIIQIILAVAVAAIPALAQSASLSLSSATGAPGGTATLSVTLATHGVQIAGVQWDLLYTPPDLSPNGSSFYVTGGAATAAGKQTTCNIVSPGDVRCLVVGFNSTAINDGVLAGITFTISSSTTVHASQLTFSGVSGTDTSSNPQSVSINATGSTVSIAQNNPTPPPATLSSVICNQNAITPPGSAACAVYLSANAASGVTVNLSAGSGMSVPGSVSIAAGTSSAPFAASASLPVLTPTTAIINATLSGVTRTFSLNLSPAAPPPSAPVTLSSLHCSPSTVAGGTSVSCTVSLSGAAPASGTTVSLTSSSANVVVPASVSVPNGANSVGFNAFTTVVSSMQTASISASAGGVTQSANVILQPAMGSLSSLTCSPAALPPGGSTTCVVLTGYAVPAATNVSLTSNNQKVAVPGSVTIQAGATSASFTVTAQTVTTDFSATLTAALNNASVTFSLQVSTQASIQSVNCSPTTVVAGASATCTVTLTQASGSPINVLLSASDPKLSIPLLVQIGAGATSTTFKATAATSVNANKSVTISAGISGIISTATLNLSPLDTKLSVTKLTCTPQTLTGGGAASCNVTLSVAAPAGGASVVISAGSTQMTMPGTAQVAEGSTSGQFNLTSALIDHDENAAISATYGGSSAQTMVALVGLKPLSLSCSPKSVTSKASFNCQIALNSAQVTSSLSLSVSSSNEHAIAPASVSNQLRQATIIFPVSTTLVSNVQSAVIAAVFHGITIHDTVTISPAAPILNLPGRLGTRPGKLVGFTVTASDPAGLPVSITVSGILGGAVFNAINGYFSWIPLATQIGIHSVHFTATNLALVSTTQDVVVDVGSDTPIILSLANAASFQDDGGCSPNAVVSLLGAGFVNMTSKSAQDSPIPTEVNGVRIKVDGGYQPVLFAGEEQVNFQCPALAPGDKFTLIVESSTGVSAPLNSTMRWARPGIFTLDATGKGQGAVLIANSATIAMPHSTTLPSQPAKGGEYISIYATGLGPVKLDVAPGQAAPLDKLANAKLVVDVLIDGKSVPVTFAGLAPGYTGLYQVNAQVPATVVTRDAVPVQVVVHLPDGSSVSSNIVTIATSANVQ